MDVLICATGFDVSNRPHFDAKGKDGYVFTDEWAKSPRGYMTIAMDKMPNYFGEKIVLDAFFAKLIDRLSVFNGPNAPLANGSLIPAMEKEGDYDYSSDPEDSEGRHQEYLHQGTSGR